jgi:hypothetical protein
VCAESGASLLLVSHDEEILGQFGEAEDFHAINTAAGAGSP